MVLHHIDSGIKIPILWIPIILKNSATGEWHNGGCLRKKTSWHNNERSKDTKVITADLHDVNGTMQSESDNFFA